MSLDVRNSGGLFWGSDKDSQVPVPPGNEQVADSCRTRDMIQDHTVLKNVHGIQFSAVH